MSAIASDRSLSFEGRVQTRRLALHACRAGSGAPLLFIGGSNFDMRVRRPVFASALPGRFDVLAYEPRGLGRSDRPEGAWTMADYAEDACALLDALGWERAHVVGESFGAMTAAELAIRHPSRVAALCLMAGAPGGAGGSSYPIERLLTLSGRERAVASLRLQDLAFEAAQHADVEATEAAIAARIASDSVFFGDAANVVGYPKLLGARADHDVYDRLHRISAPTVVMSGARDGQAPAEGGRAMAQAIAGARFWTFDGGHTFAFATPDPIDRLLAHWDAAGA